MNITHGLRRALQVNPNGLAVVCGERRRNWREVGTRVARLASGIRALGAANGDRVAILSLNSDRYLELYLAVGWAGAVIVPLNIRWSPIENEDALRDCRATILFVDIVRSTEKAARLGDSRWATVMNHYYAAVRRELKALRGKEVVTTGDGVLATFGKPAAGIRCATAIREAVRTLGLEIRIGLHAGEYKVSGAEVIGLAFHIGARVAAKARAGEVLVSSAVKDLMLKSEVRFKDRGAHQLKGVPERWRLYRVEP